ncbi:MAG TPA: DegT/DnrJ/EryC1/StrS family aminotransferase [Candidatus Ozemobacteraceae bacterium]
MIRLSKSVVGKSEADEVVRVLLEDGYLGMGREVMAFEEELAGFLGVPAKNIAVVNSGTAALHLAVAAATRPGDEVLVQSLTFVSDFQAITAAGATPVACEVRESDFTIDLDDAEKRLTPRTKAIMPVHYASNPGDLDAIYAFAKKHDLRVIEDAAHAFGCTWKGKLIGSFGDIACFSFDGIKNITSGEGGAVVSADPEVLSRVQDARLLGVEKDTEKRYAGQRSWDFDVKHQGYRYHLSNVLAAIGRVQLRRFRAEFAPKRVALAARYRERLGNQAGIALLDVTLGPVVPHIQPIRVLDGKRDQLRMHLDSIGIQTGIHYKPNHLLTRFASAGVRPFPVTERVYGEFLSLPLHPGLDERDVDTICTEIADFLGR